MKIFILLLVLAISLAFSVDFLEEKRENTKPIVGILTMPSDFPDKFSPLEYSYFGAAYVKFLESSGHRVVPILYDYDENKLREIFNSINGLLLPGGDASLWLNETTMVGKSRLTKTVQKLLDWAIEANEKGDYFPVWGTCLGYESLVIYFSQNVTLDRFNSQDHTANLTFVNEESRLFKDLPFSLKNFTENENSVFLWHSYGKSYDDFLMESKLHENLIVNTITKDFNGKTFVSSIEHKKYPIFGTQFHPEVTLFQFGSDIRANRDQRNMFFSQYLTNFIKKHTKKSLHRFKNPEEEEKSLIYNYAPEKYLDIFYEQAYIFPNAN